MSIKIGFSNLDERNDFAREMREQLERVVAKHSHIQLILRDNEHNTERAIANVKEFAHLGVNIAIIYHIDERAGMRLVTPLRQNRIPVIAVEFNLPMAASIRIDNRQAGEMSGRVGGKWIRDNWGGRLDKIVIMTDQRVIFTHKDRFMSAQAALGTQIPLKGVGTLWLDSGTESQLAAVRFAELLQSWEGQTHIAVITMGDVVSRGVLEAARALEREQDIVLMSFDGTEWSHEEFKNPASRLIVSPYFNLGLYCEQILTLAQAILKGERVSPNTLVQPVLLARIGNS